MPTSILVQLLLLFTTAAVAFALWKGRAAERAAALVVFLNMVVALAIPQVFPRNGMVELANDAVAAIAMLAITIRYAAPWMGGVMFFYAAQFALHSYYLVSERAANDYLHALLNNLNFSGVTWCLIIGTALGWRQRNRARQAPAQAAP